MESTPPLNSTYTHTDTHLLKECHQHCHAIVHTLNTLSPRPPQFHSSSLPYHTTTTTTHTETCPHRTPPHQHFGLVHFLADLTYAAHLPVLHGEVAGAAGDLKQEVPQHFHAPLRQVYLRVELRAVELLLLVSDTCDERREPRY